MIFGSRIHKAWIGLSRSRKIGHGRIGPALSFPVCNSGQENPDVFSFSFLSCAALLVLSLPLFARIAPPTKTAFARAQHPKHGINASEWLALP